MERKGESYIFIGKLALGLYTQQIKIRFGTLHKIMENKGSDYVNKGRGMGAVVKGAYNYWINEDPVIAAAISYTYTDIKDQLSWK